MRGIDELYIHCTDSDNPAHDDISVIQQWHTDRGFIGPDGIEGTEDDVGYHALVKLNGDIQLGRPIDAIGAHVKGYNARSVAVAYSGKKPSKAQVKSLLMLARFFMAIFELPIHKVKGHYEADPNKTCPNMDMNIFRKQLKEK